MLVYQRVNQNSSNQQHISAQMMGIYAAVSCTFSRYALKKHWSWLRSLPENLLLQSGKNNAFLPYVSHYPLVNVYVAMENHHCEWENSLISMTIFNSYVKLPEGKSDKILEIPLNIITS